MSEALDAALKKMAQMEAEIAALKKASAPTPAFDEDAFARALTADPVGTMSRYGAPIDHITRILVANAMGNDAPPELKVLQQQGPLMNATRTLDRKVEELSQQLSSLTRTQQLEGRRKSFRALIEDKSKYPNLAKAAADPTLMEEFESSGATAEDFATRLENRLKLVAPALTASDASAEQPVPSTQDTLASSSGGVPPLPAKSAEASTSKSLHEQLKAETLRKFASQAQ